LTGFEKAAILLDGLEAIWRNVSSVTFSNRFLSSPVEQTSSKVIPGVLPYYAAFKLVIKKEEGKL
jgi:hypothetical protein